MRDDRAASTPGSSSQALRRQAEAWGTGMLRRFGWFHWLLGLRRALSHVKLDDASAERVRDAAETGPVVYVLLQASNLDHLALNHVLNQRRLPLSIWANGVTQFFWQPVGQAWGGLFQRAWARVTGDAPADPVRSGWLAQALADDAPVTLFLEPAAGLWRGVGFRWSDPIPALIDAQARTDRPIQVLPVVVLWQRGLSRQVHPALRAVLPDPERPWGISRLLKLVLYPSDSAVFIGAAVDLGEFLERVPVVERRHRTLYALLRRYLRREGEVVRGPRLPSRTALRTLVLDNPPMRAIAEAEATRTGHSAERVRRRMEREYDRIAAHMRWWVIRFLEVALRPLWTRVYSGVDAPEADIERIREAIRHGAAIALPSHKSHFDYLLLAWVFYQHKLTLPHVVAGMNLAIPVVSFFLRSAGGFFIERSFTDKTLHPHIFSRYLRELVHHGAPIEFYMEGGRTRSGKLLAPKVGVLEMVFDAAALRPTGREVTLLPIALAYEQVAEQRAYVRELGGGKKRKEDLGEVARASRIVGRRLGRVYLRVGPPISLGPLLDATEDQPAWSARPPSSRRALLDRVARAVMHQVGNHTVLLPTTLVALGLLAHHRRGIRQTELIARVTRFRDLTARHGVPEAASLGRFDEAIRLSLARLAEQRVIEPLEHDGERIWAVRVERRLELDFAKNQGMHPFAAAGLAVVALRGRVDAGVQAQAIDEDIGWLAHLWRREFLLDPELDAAGLRAVGLSDLEAHGAVAIDDRTVTLADRERTGEVYGLFVPFLEAYRIVAELAPTLGGERLGRKDWAGAIQRRGDALLAAGVATRPESLSLVTLENAVKTLLDDGILTEADGGRLTAIPDRLSALRARLDPLVGR